MDEIMPMPSATPLRSPWETVRDGQLVVDPRHREQVELKLAELHVPSSGAEVNDDLDLVLLTGLDLTSYVHDARVRYENEIAALTTPDRPFTPLDLLLHDLRSQFAAGPGSVPVMGKNRDAVIGNPQHKHLNDPKPLPSTITVTLSGEGAGTGVGIGIVDTPLARHELLPDGVVTADETFADGQGPVAPWAGHSTFVAGLIRQAAPGATLHLRKGLEPDDGAATTWEVAKKIASFRFPDIQILNLSLGCVTSDGEAPLLFRRALARLDPRILVIAAAGSRPIAAAPDGSPAGGSVVYQPVTLPLWPAASTAVIAVGAADAAFSPSENWVDCVAPGVDVLSSYLRRPVTMQNGSVKQFSGMASWTGTSFATATVSGLVAARMTTAGGVSAKDALDLLLKDTGSTVQAFGLHGLLLG